jgi:hypothetical protein
MPSGADGDNLDAATINMLSDYVSAQQLPDDRPVFALKQRQVRNIAKRYGSVIGKTYTYTPCGTALRSTVCGTAGISGDSSRCADIRV